MPVGVGWKGQLAYQWTSTPWGSYSAPAANDELIVESAEFRAETARLPDAQFNAYPMQYAPKPGAVSLTGNFSGIYRYEGLERLVQTAMGSSTTWASTGSVVADYAGDFMVVDTSGATPDNSEDFDTNFLSFAINQSGIVGSYWELFGGMTVQSLNFTWRRGDYLRYTARLVGGVIDGAAVKSNAPDKPYRVDQAAPASISKLANHQSRLALSQHANTAQDSANVATVCGFWVQDRGTGAGSTMGNTHRIKCSDWSFNIENDLAMDVVDYMSDPFLAYPVRNAVRISGSFTLPVVESSASFTDAIELRSDYMEGVVDIDTDVQRNIAVLKLVGLIAYTNGTNNWSICFIVPACVIMSLTDLSLARRERIPATFAWEAFADIDATGATPTEIFRGLDGFWDTQLTAATKQRLPWIVLQNTLTALP